MNKFLSDATRNPRELQALREAAGLLDTNHDGHLSFDELQRDPEKNPAYLASKKQMKACISGLLDHADIYTKKDKYKIDDAKFSKEYDIANNKCDLGDRYSAWLLHTYQVNSVKGFTTNTSLIPNFILKGMVAAEVAETNKILSGHGLPTLDANYATDFMRAAKDKTR